MLGKLFSSHKVVVERCLLKPLPFIIALVIYCLLVVVSMVFYPQQAMNFHTVQYYNVIICLLLILAGITCCIYVSTKLKSNFLNKIIALMGQHTLVVYLLNGSVVSVITKVFRKLGFGSDGFSLVTSIVIAILACIICTVVSVICERVCPILVGKKRK